MDYFLAQILLILPVIGINAFRSLPSAMTSQAAGNGENSSDIVRLKLSPKKYSYEAIAVERDGEFVVLAGSTAAANPDHTINQYEGLRSQLIADAILVADESNPELLRFTRDQVFKSPSAAGAVVNGRNTSGPREWKVESLGISLKEFQAKQLEALGADEDD